ncbi:Centromere-associated protein E [Pseudolycoriella hygida]|uniref:Centromere-associated protein E n=1 Tax=Pseudolycoriella hygida TaxID=35572 RepID=A0A9Q0NFR8_9DIPT|nr:Centromere-associated protein E [Pseudolycoriella hygida]
MTKVKFVIKVKGQPSSKKKLRNKELWKRAVAHFNFDHVLDPTTKNWNVYEVIAPIVQSFKDGYNGTILAYGQALSGKTYTMMGTAADPGVKVLAIRQLMCERIFSSTRCFIIRVGYMEILNEVVFDLLNQRELVYFCQRSKNKIEHTNREIFVKDEASILQLLDEGNKQLAPKSSSSTVFQIIIESQDEAIEDEPVRLSYLNLVELNDSEGLLTKTTSRNKSIECLKLAFEALSDGKPFENCSESKLTTLLASTCMGNANIAIICNIVPTVLDQTYNLLSFVDKFRNVETPLCDYTDYSILTKLQCRIEQLIENGAEENSDEIEKLKSVFLTEEDMRDDAGSCKIFKEVLPLFSESHNKLDCKYHIIKMV